MGVDLGFGEEEEVDLRFWREEDDGGMGQLIEWDFNQKEKNPWDFGQNCKFAIGSTLGGRLMVHRNSKKLMNKF